MRAWWLCVIAVGACGRIGFDAIGDGSVPNGDGRGGDSSMGSGFSGSGCLAPGIGDSFDEIMPCKAWGEPVVDNSSLNVSNGQLTITPQANASSAGGCLLGSMPFTDAGFFVQIGQFPSAGQLQLEIDDVSNDISWAIAENDLLVIELIKTGDSMPATIPFDTSLTWWRLRPTGTSVVYETSADGETWTVQRTAPGAAPTTVAATIEDIVDDPVPGTAIIDGIDICP